MALYQFPSPYIVPSLDEISFEEEDLNIFNIISQFRTGGGRQANRNNHLSFSAQVSKKIINILHYALVSLIFLKLSNIARDYTLII